jgi:uncharacterized membrane protein
MATIMSANVFFIIIPNQGKVIADLHAGRTPDPALGKAGKIRSTHNNYWTLPVVFMMVSGHYPMTFGSRYIWLIVALVLVAGALVRHFYNERHSGRGSPWWTWGVAALAMLGVIAITLLETPAARERLGLKPQKVQRVATALRPAVPKSVDDILTSRCSMCHAREPVWAGVVLPPKGVRLDTPAEMVRQRTAIHIQSVLTHAMPPGNITGMTAEERKSLAAWTGR